MISRIRGTLSQISDNLALLENNGVSYEVMLPTALADRLREEGRVGSDITFETIYYIEAGDRKSNHYPRLVGFVDRMEREFFSMLTQVPGLGVKKALKSLVMPIREIAAAIENKNPATLNRLPGVGGRLAEKIIAELHGKMTRFALMKQDQALARSGSKAPAFADEAIEVLLQLQYSRQEADRLVAGAIESGEKVVSVEQLISLIFKSEQKAQARV